MSGSKQLIKVPKKKKSPEFSMRIAPTINVFLFTGDGRVITQQRYIDYKENSI